MSFAGDLAQLLQTVTLAVAVGCGAPALIYLAARGRREKAKQLWNMENSQPQPAPPAFLTIGQEQFVPITVYVSKEFAEKFVEQGIRARMPMLTPQFPQASFEQRKTEKKKEKEEAKPRFVWVEQP